MVATRAGRWFAAPQTAQPVSGVFPDVQYLNLPTAVLDAPQFIGAAPVERATWLCLLRYCAGQENGGKIEKCGDWPDRKWQQLARVTLEEVKAECDLWEWTAIDEILVWAYPIDGQNNTQRLRKQSKLANEKRWNGKEKKINGHRVEKGEVDITQGPHGDLARTEHQSERLTRQFSKAVKSRVPTAESRKRTREEL